MIASSPLSDLLQREWVGKGDIVNSGVAEFCDVLRQEVNGEDEYLQTAVESYISLLARGGKRTRGILAVTGYEIFDGRNKAAIATAAGVIEAFHAYLLVMDDVADVSTLRRGGPTAHVFLRDFLARRGMTNHGEKLGIDAAQSAALVAQHKAQSLFLQIEGVPAAHKIVAAEILNDHLARTGAGQVLDILAPSRSDVREDDILKIATYKTAYYSFLLPLQVGAALAGASRAELDIFVDYATNAGLAFQLQDDIIGLFGEVATTGKSSKDDVREGKRTYIMTAALEKAAAADRAILLAALGSDVSDEVFAHCLDIVKKTGALDKTQALVNQYIELALASLQHVPTNWKTHHVQFLRDFALFAARRSS